MGGLLAHIIRPTPVPSDPWYPQKPQASQPIQPLTQKPSGQETSVIVFTFPKLSKEQQDEDTSGVSSSMEADVQAPGLPAAMVRDAHKCSVCSRVEACDRTRRYNQGKRWKLDYVCEFCTRTLGDWPKWDEKQLVKLMETSGRDAIRNAFYLTNKLRKQSNSRVRGKISKTNTLDRKKSKIVNRIKRFKPMLRYSEMRRLGFDVTE